MIIISNYHTNIFSVKYPFIYDDLFLIAEVDKNSGNQWLVMQKIDPRTLRVLIEDRIQCIHTAITTYKVEEFENKINSENFEKDMLNIRSSEGIQEIKLDPKEKFFAFKSWVEGIAEADINAISIQEDIEQFARLFHPIGNRLFNFLLRAKIDFIQVFLSQIERDCRFEGKYHKPSINANLMKLLKIMILEENEAWNRWRDVVKINYTWYEDLSLYLVKNFDEVMDVIYELRPSANIFLEEDKFNFILTLPGSKVLDDWEKVTQDSVVYNNVFHFCYKNEETGLLAIDLYANKITSLDKITYLERISHLQQLNFQNNWLEKIEGFEAFPNLRELHLNYNFIERIKNLDHLLDLEVLYITNNPIKKIEGLNKLVNLKELYLFDNKIRKIEGLDNLIKLECLHLSGNEIEKISGLESLINLKKLILRMNKISKVEGLESLVNLENLDLNHNYLTEIPDLSYLPKLKNLKIKENPFNRDLEQ